MASLASERVRIRGGAALAGRLLAGAALAACARERSDSAAFRSTLHVTRSR